MTARRWLYLSAAGTALAGLVHLWHGGSHVGTLALFFYGAGAIQIVLAMSAAVGVIGSMPLVGFNSVLIGLYAASRLPLGLPAEPVEAVGIIAKVLESASVCFGLLAARSHALSRSQSAASSPAGGTSVSRRGILAAGSLGALGVMTGAVGRGAFARSNPHRHALAQEFEGAHFHLGNVAVGQVDTTRFDPMAYLRDFDRGEVSTDASGRTVRTFRITALDLEIEVAPGVMFPAWAYQSATSPHALVPGPTLRATQGDLVRVHFT
ncbi:MAG: hypothetical protein ACRDI1_05220, partial [Actinomycetota bacterium]